MSTPEGAFSVFPLAAAVTAPAGALSVFHHYRSSDRSPQEHYLYFPTATAVLAPAGAFPSPGPSPAPPPPSSLPAFFFTTAVVAAHAGTFSIFPTTAVVPAPAGSFSIFPHCPSSDRSRRSTSCFVPTTAVVSAPAGALSLFPLPQQCLLPQERFLNFLTAAAVLAPAGDFPSVPSPSPTPPPSISSLPQQCSLQQEPLPPPPPSPLPFPTTPRHHRNPPPAVFFTTAVVPALAGTFPIFPHCRSSACSNRNLLYISPLPQQ